MIEKELDLPILLSPTQKTQQSELNSQDLDTIKVLDEFLEEELSKSEDEPNTYTELRPIVLCTCGQHSSYQTLPTTDHTYASTNKSITSKSEMSSDDLLPVLNSLAYTDVYGPSEQTLKILAEERKREMQDDSAESSEYSFGESSFALMEDEDSEHDEKTEYIDQRTFFPGMYFTGYVGENKSQYPVYIDPGSPYSYIQMLMN